MNLTPSIRKLLALIGTALVASLSLSHQALAQEPVYPISKCVEAPGSAVDASRRRTGRSTNCDDDARRAEGIAQSRTNAAHALFPICVAAISDQERQGVCAAQGLAPKPAGAPGDMSGFVAIPGNPNGSVDATFPISGEGLCVVVRDLPDEYTSQAMASQWAGLGDCLVFAAPFITSEPRTLFTARARARCGVQCR